MNTDDRVPQTDTTPEDISELDNEQMEEITGGVKSISWSGGGGEENPTEN
jgi:hypothetical protein